GLTKLTTNVQTGTDGQGPVYSLDVSPSWSPDGSRIAFASNCDAISQHELYVMEANGNNQTRLTNNPNQDDFPTWSPDSQKIAFFRSGGSDFGLNIINRDGTNQVNVSHDGVGPAWSPDGSR